MSVNKFILYGYQSSSATKRVMIALKLKHVAYDYVEIDLLEGEHLSPAFSQLNVQRKVPMLAHGQYSLMQSLAIIEYLDEIVPPQSLLPESPTDRAWSRSFAGIFISDYHPLITRRVIEKLRSSDFDEDEIRGWKTYWLEESLRVAEDMMSEKSIQSSFCCGSSPGLADICLFAQCESARKQEIDLNYLRNVSRIYVNCSKIDDFRN
ncbi:glutathione S-transferase N-terminal domain-containing protein [Xenorhabdus bovienii]|uniref:Maleylpyruvate isomerase n=1 Tax=Xenorhabdus bovienii str. kraussei Becker Underwood TaxID=1398204 RepID=A0A077PUQ0_XENBV|nr:glutathione S-transferase N-terminal domain-containing protein [Xenorhabdus bovienii]CDH23584.1 Maleylpyruvate isomerase [Xenorhabdus bovienii str. kraussei Becker Underwood]